MQLRAPTQACFTGPVECSSQAVLFINPSIQLFALPMACRLPLYLVQIGYIKFKTELILQHSSINIRQNLKLLTLLKRGSNRLLAFGVAMTLRFGDFWESGFKVFKWQWSSRLWVINKQSTSGRSVSCSRITCHEKSTITTNNKSNIQSRATNDHVKRRSSENQVSLPLLYNSNWTGSISTNIAQNLLKV